MHVCSLKIMFFFLDTARVQPFTRVVKRGSRSRFTENKTFLLQFAKNKIGISRFTENNKDNENMVHGELIIYFSFHGK